MNRKFPYLLMATSMLPFLSIVQAAAQPDESDVRGGLLEEITITAQKREQDLQTVGIAVTAFTGDQLRTLGLVDSKDIAKMSPNVSISGSYGGQMAAFTVRGVTQNDFNDHVESVIAVYIDETYVSMQQGQAFGMFDLERVEVLKGPQGTLFGRNATGGLIHFVTRRPTDEFEGRIEGTYGSFDHVRVESAFSGPLADNISARISGFFERHDGYLKNKYPEETFVPAELQGSLNSVTLPGAGADLGGLKSNWALRGQVLADISENVELWVSGFYNESAASTGPYQSIPSVTIFDDDGTHVNTILASPTEVCQSIQSGACISGPFSHDASVFRPVPGGDFFGYVNPDGSGRITSSDYAFDDVNTFRTYGASAKVTIDLDAVTITSITDYKNFLKDFNLDLEAAPVNQFVWHGISESESFTQELRVDGSTDQFEWVLGGYFLYIDNYSVHGIAALPDSAFPIPSWDQPRIVDMETKSYSLFGQVEYALSDTVTLIGGLRGTREKKNYEYEVLFVFLNDDGNPFGWDFAPSIEFPGFSQGLFAAKSSETLWTWRAQVNWQPTDDILLYASITQGAKAGSFNAGGPPLAFENIPYDSEKLISYELGLKSTLFGGLARFNVAAFYYDYQDYQAAQWLGFSSLITNADARIYGLEAELSASITENLEGMFNIGLQQSKVKDVLVAGELRDVETTYAPEIMLSSMLRYTLPASVLGGRLSLQVDGNYQSKVWHNLNNFEANRLDGYVIANSRVRWVSDDYKWSIDLFVNNLFDKGYDNVGFDLSQICGCTLISQGKPRWFGIKVGSEF